MNYSTLPFLGGAAAIAVLAILLYTIYRKPEKSATLTGIGICGTFTLGLIMTLLVPSFNENWSFNTSRDETRYHAVYNADALPTIDAELAGKRAQPLISLTGLSPEKMAGYTKLQTRGRLIYQREGCMYCHSQFVRPLVNEMRRYSIGASEAPPADEREYVFDQPHFLGTRRIGPDLSREGGKYSDDWQYSHLFYPRQMVPGSIMPAFTWLFTFNPADPSVPPVPNDDARALIAYVQTLGFGRQVYDQSLNGGQGGWRPWLKPEDQQLYQRMGESAVERAAQPVRGGDQTSPTNKVQPPGSGQR